jgi:hypothetical protein
MAESIKRRVAGLSNSSDKKELKKLLDAAKADLTAVRAEVVKLVADVTANRTLQNNKCLTSAGLTIASGKKTATAGSAFFYIAGGTAGYKAAGDLSALVGTIADAKSAGWAFYIDSAGTVTTSAKTADVATVALAAADLLALARPANKAVIGYLIVSTSGATFVGGTTDLDAGTATDVYFSLVGEEKALAAITSASPAALTLTE